jgi:hypothetical protein
MSICSYCGETLSGPHSWQECLAVLKESAAVDRSACENAMALMKAATDLVPPLSKKVDELRAALKTCVAALEICVGHWSTDELKTAQARRALASIPAALREEVESIAHRV